MQRFPPTALAPRRPNQPSWQGSSPWCFTPHPSTPRAPSCISPSTGLLSGSSFHLHLSDAYRPRLTWSSSQTPTGAWPLSTQQPSLAHSHISFCSAVLAAFNFLEYTRHLCLRDLVLALLSGMRAPSHFEVLLQISPQRVLLAVLWAHPVHLSHTTGFSL